MATPVNYTTKIDAAQTVAEMQTALSKHGARRISVDYDDSGVPNALSFSLTTTHGLLTFCVPCDVDRMQELLRAEDKAGRLTGLSKAMRTSREHAERVAWRVMKVWLDAQLTLVAASMVDLDQALLPFLQVDDAGTTLYDQYLQRSADVASLQSGHPAHTEGSEQ